MKPPPTIRTVAAVTGYRLPMTMRVVETPSGRDVIVRIGRVVVGRYPLRDLTEAVTELKAAETLIATVPPSNEGTTADG